MKTAKELFEDRLDELRKFANEKNVHLSLLLQALLNDSTQNVDGFGLLFDRRKYYDGIVGELVERYRLKFYEETLDSILKEPNINLFAIPKKIMTKWNDAIKDARKQKSNLAVGRAEGAKKQMEHAAETWRMVEKMNADLLKHPDTARWDLGQRAEYLEKKLKEQGRMQPNGNPYLKSTIKTKITGKG